MAGYAEELSHSGFLGCNSKVEHLKVHGEDDPKTKSMLHEFWIRTGFNGGQVISLSRTPNGSYSTDSLYRFLCFHKRSVLAVLSPTAQPTLLCAYCCSAMDMAPKHLLGPYRVLEVLSCCLKTAHRECIRISIYRNGLFLCIYCGCKAYYPTFNPFLDGWSTRRPNYELWNQMRKYIYIYNK